jgi:hypothetical protein
VSGDLETIRRIHAWHVGRPIERGASLSRHIAADDDVMIVAFLRMGGESRPWGVALGTLRNGPTVHTVPEARNRDLVADMMIEVAPILLGHFRHPQWDPRGPGGFQTQALRQIWLPGATHLEMLQFVAAAYARTRWERSDVVSLRALGNLCNALFLEAQRPGQQVVVTATDALRSAYVFPTSPLRQAHLGHLLEWLRTDGTRDERWSAAHEAERLSVSTVLDPELERRELQPLVSSWGEQPSASTASAINAVLSAELERRWSLTASTISHLRADRRPPNSGLAKLTTSSAQAFHLSWGERVMNEAAGEPPFWPNVFTDHNARGAAGSYHARVADHDEARFLLVHGDRELQREELAAGKGVIAEVTSAALDQWLVTYSYPDLTTIEAGKSLTIAGRSNMRLEVVDVDLEARRLVLVPKWKRAKSSKPYEWAADDTKWIGTSLVLLADVPVGVMRKKIKAARVQVDRDITSFLLAPRSRHAAYDDDGVVLESVEVDR